MLIVWQGWGFMAIIIPLVCSTPFLYLCPQYPKISALGWIIGGIILYFWGKHLHNPETNSIILYDEVGKAYSFKKHIDTLFWISIEHWCWIWIAFSIFFLSYEL